MDIQNSFFFSKMIVVRVVLIVMTYSAINVASFLITAINTCSANKKQNAFFLHLNDVTFIQYSNSLSFKLILFPSATPLSSCNGGQTSFSQFLTCQTPLSHALEMGVQFKVHCLRVSKPPCVFIGDN